MKHYRYRTHAIGYTNFWLGIITLAIIVSWFVNVIQLVFVVDWASPYRAEVLHLLGLMPLLSPFTVWVGGG